MGRRFGKGLWPIVLMFLGVFLTTMSACKRPELPENNAIHLLDGMQATIARNTGNCEQMASDLNQFWDRYYPNYKDAFFSMNDSSRAMFRDALRSIFLEQEGRLPESSLLKERRSMLMPEAEDGEVSALRRVALGVSEAMDGAQAKGFRIRVRPRNVKTGGGYKGSRSVEPTRRTTFVYIGGQRYERQELTPEEQVDYQAGLTNSSNRVKETLGSCKAHASLTQFGERIVNDLVDPTLDP